MQALEIHTLYDFKSVSSESVYYQGWNNSLFKKEHYYSILYLVLHFLFDLFSAFCWTKSIESPVKLEVWSHSSCADLDFH